MDSVMGSVMGSVMDSVMDPLVDSVMDPSMDSVMEPPMSSVTDREGDPQPPLAVKDRWQAPGRGEAEGELLR
jgi:hypothetical protein